MMNRMVEIAIPVAEEVAAELLKPGWREEAGRLVTLMLERRRAAGAALVDAAARMGADARANGMTDEIVEAELAACNAERRG